MRFIQNSFRPWCMAVGLLVSFSAWAVKVSPESISMASGESRTVKVEKVSGSLTVSNDSPAVVSVTRVDASTYRLLGTAAGKAEIKFKDAKSDTKVKVNVTTSTPTPPVPTTPTGSLNGRLLASNCFQCHGTNGTGGFDRLAGKSAASIYGELREFASGKEDANGIMAAHAMGFSDAQLKSIANYFASVR
jgi:cytochrome subunit of sulfide dehydrogenase